MRTTVTLDADVARDLRDLAHRRRESFKSVINEILRRGLAASERAPSGAAPYTISPFASRFRPGIDPGKLGQLLDDLETADFLDEARREA